MTEHRIEIESARRFSGPNRVGTGNVFVSYNGERIGEMRVPSCEASRWLLANGIADRSDTLVMCRNGEPSMAGLVGWFADRTVRETEKSGPRWARYEAFDDSRVDSGFPVRGSVAGGKVGSPATFIGSDAIGRPSATGEAA